MKNMKDEKKEKINFIDLFSGIGGFHIAAENANLNLREKELKCILSSEIDEKAKLVYSENFNWNLEKIVDIKEIDEKQMEHFDMLFAGFPCQTFSNAGKKEGFKDQVKGTLFWDIVRILEVNKPKYFILENVKHLVKHDSGKTWKIIQESIKKLGYSTTNEPLILSPLSIGIPQDRRRVYILGVRNDLLTDQYISFHEKKFQELFKKEPMFNNNEMLNKIENNILLNISEIEGRFFLDENKVIDKKILDALTAWDDFVKNVKFPKGKTLPVIWLDAFKIEKKQRQEFIKNMADWRKKYYKDMWLIYDANKKFIDEWAEKHNVDSWQKREKKFEWQAGIMDRPTLKNTFVQLRQSGIRCRRRTSFPTLVAMVQMPLIFEKDNKKWRYMTPKEAGKLQSFEYDPKLNKIFSNYAEIKKDQTKISDNYANKQFGNAVNTKMVQYLIEFLLNEY